ncbi:GTP binding domain containing protein [Aphelenchoides avenae]|nr:GTP binding domain containing protein [Aphelenchus avenae]
MTRLSFAVTFLLLLIDFTTGAEAREPDYDDLDDNRPDVLQRIGSDIKICIIGRTNAGKTALFNAITGADAPVSPTVFTTRTVTTRSKNVPDDRFEWLVKEFPNATQRPPTITFVDTPALLRPFDIVAWKDDVLKALHECDILFHVIRALNDSSVEKFKSCTDDNCEYEDTSVSQRVESIRVISHILEGNDSKLASKPVVYVLNMDADAFANATVSYFNRTSTTFLHAKAYIQEYEQSALVVPFSGSVQKDEKRALGIDAAVLSGADAVVDKTIEEFHIRRFFTANEHLVAAWAFTPKTTVGEAVRFLNASVPPNNFADVDAAGMRGVVEVDSLSYALGVIRHRRFDDEVIDGDLLLIAPGLLHEATREVTDTSTIPAPMMGFPRIAAPTSEEQQCRASWSYAASLTVNAILLVVLAGIIAVLTSQKMCKGVRSRFLECRLPRPERRGEALLAGVKLSIVVLEFLA